LIWVISIGFASTVSTASTASTIGLASLPPVLALVPTQTAEKLIFFLPDKPLLVPCFFLGFCQNRNFGYTYYYKIAVLGV